MNIVYALMIAMQVCVLCASDEITPYKFTDSAPSASNYEIPQSCRFTTPRAEQHAPDIVYYMSKPHIESYPIAFLCGGSTSKQDLSSIIHFHRYFLQECMDIGVATITLELWGIDGSSIDEQECMNHYTRSQRLQDHTAVIEHIKRNPPIGWNGKFVFVGVSEGGPLVTSLTTHYGEDTLATINWCGAGDYSWRQELWNFLEAMKKNMPWFVKWPLRLRMMLSSWVPFSIDFPKNKTEYNQRMDALLAHPSCDEYFLGMTHKYHADAMNYSKPAYAKIQTPFLVVAGAKDSIIDSSDAFVQKARDAGVNIIYIRVADMDHYIRRRPDIIAQSFEWLKKQIHLS